MLKDEYSTLRVKYNELDETLEEMGSKLGK